MNVFQVVILGIVEGVTEFLPISSTGHLILASHMMGIAGSEFLKSFEVIIQLGAILAVAVSTFESFRSLKTFVKIVCAFVPTAVVGFFLYKMVKTYLLGNDLVVVLALGIGGVLLILFESMWGSGNDKGRSIDDLSMFEAVGIGFFQIISIIPGVSRAAATIVGGRIFRLSRVEATKFSFLLAVPTMFAATGQDIVKGGGNFSGNEWGYLIAGVGIAFVTARFAIKWLLTYIGKHSFVGFGVYRILVALVYAAVFLRG